MQQVLYKELDILGFSSLMQRQVNNRIGTVGPHFTAAETRLLSGHMIKALAQLTFDKKAGKIAVRSYDLIDVTQRRPDLKPKDVIALENAMKAIDWNAATFTWNNLARYGIDASLGREIRRIDEALKNMAVKDVQGQMESERLRLAYMYDSLYGYNSHLDSLNGFKYNEHFPMLSLTRETGLLRISSAADLLIRHDINNYRKPEIIQAAVTAKQEITRIRKQTPARQLIGDTTTMRHNFHP